MTFELITSDRRLDKVLAEHENERFVAVDTEFRRRDTFYPQVALVQLCWRDVSYLLDPTELSDFSRLKVLLLNESIVKLLHSPSEDLEVFAHWLGILPTPLFDTQRVMGLLGYGFGVGYRPMVEQFFGVEISKEETTSDWLKRPLTDKQLNYAALDVSHLRKIGETLHDEAEASGRLAWVYEDTANQKPGGRGVASKFKSAWKLSTSEQAILSALIAWREAEAQRLDRPRSWILPDKVMVALARRAPDHASQLKQIEGLQEAVIRKRGEKLISIILESLSGSTTEVIWPAPARGIERDWIATMTERVQALAEVMGVAPQLLLSTRDFESLIQVKKATSPLPKELSGWRYEIIVAELLKSLNTATPPTS
jgi:ribonuclease D